jgi:hypothetical protein
MGDLQRRIVSKCEVVTIKELAALIGAVEGRRPSPSQLRSWIYHGNLNASGSKLVKLRVWKQGGALVSNFVAYEAFLGEKQT